MRRVLAVFALALVAACQDAPVSVPASLGGPSFAISDGANGGNPHFFFLPPLVKLPTITGTFTPNAEPSVVICVLTFEPCGTGAAVIVKTFAPSEISVSLSPEQYQVNWKTGVSEGISTANDYRIEVRAAGFVLGFRDVDPKDSPTEVPRNPETNALYAFLNGSTIPIKFWIGRGFICSQLGFDDVNGECNEGNLADGVTVQIPETGTGLTVPPQNFSQFVAIVVEPCPAGADLPIDLPLFGDCFEVRSTPALAQTLDPFAAVFVCEELAGLDDRTRDLVRLHKSDALDGSQPTFALPNAPGLCPFETAQADAGAGLFARVFRSVTSGIARLVTPRTLHAALLDRGHAGLTEEFSFFQLAIPSKMEKFAGDNQVAKVGTAVAIPPAVKVTDIDNFPVPGATVHFNVITGGGTVVPLQVVSDANGIAQVTSWTLGAVGLNQLRAFGRGIADPVTNGPQPFFDPFKPIPLPNPYDETPVQLQTGELIFNATGCADGFGTPVIDGVLDAAWACAQIDLAFSANVSGGPSTPARLLIMNDATNLYLAVVIRRSSADKPNTVTFLFDKFANGVPDLGEDILELSVLNGVGVFRDMFRTAKCVKSGQSVCGDLDTSDGGTSDGSGAWTNDGTWSVYEIAHPLKSADPAHDIQLSKGDAARLYAIVRLGNGSQGNTEVPGFQQFLSAQIK